MNFYDFKVLLSKCDVKITFFFIAIFPLSLLSGFFIYTTYFAIVFVINQSQIIKSYRHFVILHQIVNTKTNFKQQYNEYNYQRSCTSNF
jgi:hypothetical protein